MPLIFLTPYQASSGASVTDPLFSSVSVLMPFDTISDIKANSFTNVSVTVSTTSKKMGTGSARFNGSTSAINFSASSSFNFGTTEFTIEGWFIVDNVTGNKPIFSFANRTMLFQLQGSTPVFYLNGVSAGWAGNAGTITAGVWTHFAVVRAASGVCTLYINGVATGQTPTQTGTLGSSTVAASIGTDATGGAFLLGNVDDFRITKAARYTANFTPPTTPYPTS